MEQNGMCRTASSLNSTNKPHGCHGLYQTQRFREAAAAASAGLAAAALAAAGALAAAAGAASMPMRSARAGKYRGNQPSCALLQLMNAASAAGLGGWQREPRPVRSGSRRACSERAVQGRASGKHKAAAVAHPGW